MTITNDHRKEWGEGPDPELGPTKAIGPWERRTAALLKKYLAMHGDWREVTSHTNGGANAAQSWDFTVCQCDTCQAAVKLVGHPTTPNG